MFFANSRYAQADVYTARDAAGRDVLVVRVPARLTAPVTGYHRRLQGQRLDHMAAHYLTDATASWRLCDANGAIVPDVQGVAELVGIPRTGA
jgi:hypothetical protein